MTPSSFPRYGASKFPRAIQLAERLREGAVPGVQSVRIQPGDLDDERLRCGKADRETNVEVLAWEQRVLRFAGVLEQDSLWVASHRCADQCAPATPGIRDPQDARTVDEIQSPWRVLAFVVLGAERPWRPERNGDVAEGVGLLTLECRDVAAMPAAAGVLEHQRDDAHGEGEAGDGDRRDRSPMDIRNHVSRLYASGSVRELVRGRTRCGSRPASRVRQPHLFPETRRRTTDSVGNRWTT